MRKSWRMLSASVGVGALTASGLVASSGLASAAGSNKAPIVVGGIWSGATYAGADVGAKAVFNAFNAAGGLDGRKIKFIGMSEDDANPTQALADAKALVAQHVFAVVPVMTEAWQAGPVLAKAGIPYFGWGISTGWWQSNNGFSVAGAGVAPSASAPKTTVSTAALLCPIVPGGCKGKTVSLVAINNAAAINALQASAAEWKAAGAKVVQTLSSIPEPPAVVSDFTPYVDQLLTANHGKPPDIIQQVLPPNDDIGVISGLNHLGFKGQDFSYSLYDPRAVGIAKGSNILITFAPFEQNTPAIKQVVEQVKAVDPNVTLGQPTLGGYWSARLFVAALKKAGPNVTPQSLIATLNKGFSYGVPGGLGTVSFPADHAGGPGCSSVVASNGTAYHVVRPLVCLPPIKNPLHK